LNIPFYSILDDKNKMQSEGGSTQTKKAEGSFSQTVCGVLFLLFCVKNSAFLDWNDLYF